jgi:hypothetical protein
MSAGKAGRFSEMDLRRNKGSGTDLLLRACACGYIEEIMPTFKPFDFPRAARLHNVQTAV